MQSSTSPSKPPTPAKQQQPIPDMLSPNTNPPPGTSKSTKPKHRPSAAVAQLLRNPYSFTVPELKTILRAEGKPVSGNKTQLLDRLLTADESDGLSMDKDGNPLPPRAMSPSNTHPLGLIPFDGQGLDPASLIGRRIHRYETGMGTGFILHTDQGTVTITFTNGVPFSRYADIAADDALLEGLKSVERVDVLLEGLKSVERVPEASSIGGEESTRGEREKAEKKKAEGLLIVEAAVGRRNCPDRGAYRVIGIRCEGMAEMGFVFAEDEELEDIYGPAPRFGDVALAAGSGFEG
ncbi:MAG: hypothetical protein ASARMPRED_005938 [Alectoria sarmentosa]|nr:MAG: hypothetical protein ASARMPRED_005938 [Alectoria sarmentosa]